MKKYLALVLALALLLTGCSAAAAQFDGQEETKNITEKTIVPQAVLRITAITEDGFDAVVEELPGESGGLELDMAVHVVLDEMTAIQTLDLKADQTVQVLDAELQENVLYVNGADRGNLRVCVYIEMPAEGPLLSGGLLGVKQKLH